MGDNNEKEIKITSLIKPYEPGRISSGMAFGILGISRIDFLEKLGDYKVSYQGYTTREELDENITNA